MNKVVIARILATLLGLCLVTITAIKFDWIGMVKRGDSLIQWKTEKKQENHEAPEQIKEETPQNEVEISCTKAVSENNLFVTNTLNVYFMNDTIHTTSLDVHATYSDSTGKSAFDAFVQNYTKLYTSYQGIEGVMTSTIPGDTEFQYHQDMYYGTIDEATLTTKGLPALEPAKNITRNDFQQNYIKQGYTCEQH